MLYFYISLLTYLCFCIIKYREGIYYLKKDKYDSKKFLNRIISDRKKIFLNLEILSLVLIIVCFNFDSKVIGICVSFVYMILFLYKLKTNNKVIKKDKKIIPRVVFITFIYLLLNVWFIIDYMSYHRSGVYFDNSALYYIILVLVTYLSYFVIYLSNVFSNIIKK